MSDVVVIGAGLAGLTAAHRLLASGADVTVIDSASVAGGHMRTIQREGWRHENGPNSFLGSASALISLADELALELVPARPVSKKRYLFLDGRLQALPGNPIDAITTPTLPFTAKLRALWEPFKPGVPTEETSIRDFFTERFGSEVTERFVDAFVSGVYAGDIAETSLAAAFPRIYEQVRVHKSLVRAIPSMAKASRSPNARRGTFSLRGGLGDLPAAIVARLGDRLRLGVDASIERDGAGWRVGNIRTRAVVVATPSYAAAAMLRRTTPALAEALDAFTYNPIVGVHLLYRRDAVPRPLDGFGFLIPRREKVRLLGCVWSSSLFDVCAADHVALTCFIGGAHDRAAVGLSEEELVAQTRSDLKRTLGIEAAPEDTSVVRIPRAIPAYSLKHLANRAQVSFLLKEQPGLFLTGNYLEGVSMNDTVAAAEKVARAAFVGHSTEKQAA